MTTPGNQNSPDEEIARECADELIEWIAGPDPWQERERKDMADRILAALRRVKAGQEEEEGKGSVLQSLHCVHGNVMDICDKCNGLVDEALPASTQATAATQKKYSSASAAIYDFEQSLVDALKLVRLAHSNVSRTFEGDGGGAHPSLGLMEISQRALNQANDAARYARHALSAVVPQP